MRQFVAVNKQVSILCWIFLCCGTITYSYEQDPSGKDYDECRNIKTIKEPGRRAVAWLNFLDKYPKSQLVSDAQNDFMLIVQDLANQSRWLQTISLADRFIELRPRVGLIYYFLGHASNELKRYPEAMDALAKCSILRCPASESAKRLLETIYKTIHQGSTDGMEALIKNAKTEIGKLPEYRSRIAPRKTGLN